MKRYKIILVHALVFILIPAGAALAADITFFACSDTHYAATAEQNKKQSAGVELINSLPGTPYPDSLGAGTVDTPRGILVLGDLINDGAVAQKNTEQWKLWQADFGVNGEGKCKFPVYEGFGNHDLHSSRFVQEDIKKRNLLRKNLAAISKNGLHYSWDWDGVHFVQLNLYPGNTWTTESNYGSIHDPEYALDFLAEDLKTNVGDSGRPVILTHHYDPRDDWWTDKEKAAYYNLIKNYNIICIIHGHTGTGIYKWNGIDVVNEGNLPGGGVFVFLITQNNQLIVAQRTPDNTWRTTFKKSFASPDRAQAFNPSPSDGFKVTDTQTKILSWKTPANDITSQDLYFGTSLKDIQNSGKPDESGIRPEQNSCDIPAGSLPLKPGTEYFWRVDQNQKDKPIIKGKIWSFRTKDTHIKNNITFIVVSDTHYQNNTLKANYDNIQAMNAIAGTPYPADIGGFVRTPLGLIHCGDCTSDSKEWQWNIFTEDYGINGEGLVNYPVYEIYGNHDGGLGSVVGDGIVQRNKQRANLMNISENGLHYAWNFDGIHFVSLGSRPGTEARPYNPHHSLEFLKEDLEKNIANTGKAIILFHHFGFDAAHSLNWWTEKERQDYLDLISSYNIIGIFHGHSHVCEIYTYNGIDIFNAPHMRWEPEQLGFFIVNITPDTMTIAERKHNGTWGLYKQKNIYLSYEDANIPAVVNNASGSSNITATTSTINGKLVYQNKKADKTNICFYWGTSDGEMDKNAWAHKEQLGEKNVGSFNIELTSLSADTAYYYRCFASNPAGDAWSNSSSSLRTLPAADINNAEGATGIKMSEATLNGCLISSSAQPADVYICWGPEDGKDNEDAWAGKINIADCSLGKFSSDIDGLNPDTTYYYRCYATNKNGQKWANTSDSFKTQPAVKVTNDTGAAEITKTSAALNGNLAIVNISPTDVYIYWADNDAGTNKEKWDNVLKLGNCDAGNFTAKVSELKPQTDYYYRCYAVNSAGQDWADKTERFTTAKDFDKWAHQMKIIFAGYTKPETLRNFPALVILSENTTGFEYSRLAPDGADLRFADANDVELRFEIDSWNPDGSSYIWVQVPSISSSDDFIWAYYGNPSENKLPEYTKNGAVWTEDYATVWHMTEPDARDSLNKNHCKSQGSTSVAGLIAAAQQFADNIDDSSYIDKVSPQLDIKNNLSISAWVKPLKSKQMLGIVTKGDGWGNYNLHLKGSSAQPSLELKPFLPDARRAPIAKTSLQPENWYHLCGTWDGSTAKIYVNGIQEAASSAKGTINSSSHTLRIGAIERRYGPCQIDEVRISNIARSPDWIWASFQNQANNSSFCDYQVMEK